MDDDDSSFDVYGEPVLELEEELQVEEELSGGFCPECSQPWDFCRCLGDYFG